jgi:hypothetical protein
MVFQVIFQGSEYLFWSIINQMDYLLFSKENKQRKTRPTEEGITFQKLPDPHLYWDQDT